MTFEGRPTPLARLTVLALAVLALAALLQGCGAEPPGPAEDAATDTRADTPIGPAAPTDDRVAPVILRALVQGETRDVLVLFNPPTADAGDLPGGFASTANALVSDVPTRDLKHLKSYRNLPMVHVQVQTLDGLRALLRRPEVARIYDDERFEAFDNLALIQQPAALARGLDGNGVAVAVLDTGVDYTRSAFGSCTAPGLPSSTCRVPYANDFATNDGSLDANGHGTNVAGVVRAVAPNATVLALDVFEGQYAYSSAIIAAIDWCITNKTTYNIGALNMSLGGGSYASPCGSDVFADAIGRARTAGIISVVASGNNGYTTSLASPACVPTAVSVGAVYHQSSGAVSYSACTDSSPAADRVTCFSNSASFLTILAPGGAITAAGITMSGTSQASPHVAGAVAVLRAAYPSETPDQLIARLTGSGVSVTDHRNGIVKPRLDLDAATAGGCFYSVSPTSPTVAWDGGNATLTVTTASSCAWTASSDSSWLTITSGSSGTGPGSVVLSATANTGTTSRSATLTIGGRSVVLTQSPDLIGPTGTFTINAGATSTNNPLVTLAFSATDASGVSATCVSTTTTCSSWQTFASSMPYTLPSTQGSRTLYVWYRDARSNVSASPATASIIYDASAPYNGTVTATGGNGQVALSWTGFSDALTSVASYKVVAGTTLPSASCADGTVVYTGTATTATHSSATNGTTYYYRVCAIDAAGNTSTGATTNARPASEYTAPTGTVSINAGATHTNSATVTLTLSATDASGVTGMCISNTATCSAWVSYANTYTWTLSGQGERTVYVWFRDTLGNATATPVTDTIVYDASAPYNGTVTATGGDGQVALSWTGFSDALSSVASYKVVAATSLPSASCADGTVVYTGTATTATHSGAANGATYYYRVCAIDAAGNTSTGATASARPAPEYTAPTGSVSINAGATHTNTSTVTLTLTGTDASGVTGMCVSNTATCSAWVTFANTYSWTLSGQGERTVSVWLRDTWGNVSATPVTDTIVYDASAPYNGTVTATGGNGQVTLSWTGYSDALSSVASYKVVAGTTLPSASCADGTVVYTGTATTATHSSLTNGTTYYYRVCAIDSAGNTSTGATANARPASEYSAPTGSVTINAGATHTNSSTVTLTLSATDASGVTGMCISNTTTCTAWLTYATSATWTMLSAQGERTVSVWFRDTDGNVSTVAATDTIVYDASAPYNGTVTATGGDGQVNLSWTGFSDAISSVASYKVVAGTTLPSASCTGGTVVYTGTATTATHASLTNGTTYYYRVCAIDAAGNTSTGATTNARPASEYSAPTGTVSINAGATHTNSSTVTLTLSGTDASGVTGMCISNTTTCTAWLTYATSATWTMLSAQGERTVSVWFRDTDGNISTVAATDTIVYDASAPYNGTVTATGGSAQVALSWTGFSDAVSSVASYKVVAGTTLPSASCTDGTVVYTGTATTATHSSLTNGTTYYYRVCAIDAAGNTSTGATANARPAPEYTAPTGTVSINAGATHTNTSTVTLTLSGTDASGVTGMCVSNTATCSAWVSYATTYTWTLSGQGERTVSVWFRDTYGNTSASPATDAIVYDASAPYNGTVTATGGDGQVALSWTGFSDALSSVASYKVVASTTPPSAGCTDGSVVYTGTATTATHSSATNGTTYYYRVCAIDAASNTSTGATATARPAPEYTAPTGTVSINAGATHTNTSTVTLTLSATDANGVTGVCVSNTATCSAWLTYATSLSWTLSGQGERTVSVWFRDTYGNTSATAVTDTIVYDASAPYNGTVTATGSDGQVALSWTGFSDAVSSVASYKVVAGATLPSASCADGTVVYTGTATTATHTSLTNGTTWYYRVCAIDAAGNTSTGATANARPAPEYTAPTGTVSINAGATYTNSPTVTLTLSATDASGVTGVCVSNTATCSAWLTYATSLSWTMLSAQGERTVSVWFRDTYGNVSATAATDTIIYDGSAPYNGTVTATPGNGQVALSWTGFSDALSSVASYKVVAGTTQPSAGCTDGTVVYMGTATTATHTSLTNGTLYYYRVCAIDVVGNTSTGALRTATPAP